MKKTILTIMVAAVSISAFAAEDTAANANSAPTNEQCKAVIEGSDAMKYNVEELDIDVAACPKFTIDFKNVGKQPKNIMGHNVVIAKTADIEGISNDGNAAGLDNDYIKPGDVRVITHTKIIGGGEETTVTFETDKLEKGGDYTFFCSFPGHHYNMHGKVNVK